MTGWHRTTSLSLAATEENIRLHLQFTVYEERRHPSSDLFSHGLLCGAGESQEQLPVASAAGLERLPILLERCESMRAGLPREPNRSEPRSSEKSLERVAIGQGRRLIQDISLIREVATEFVHEDAKERHMVGGSPDAHGKSCAAT